MARTDNNSGLWRVVVLGAVAVGIAAIALFIVMRNRHEAAHERMAQGPQAQLRKLYTAVRAYHLEHGKLPSSSSPTPPLDTCCGGPDQLCVPVAALWRAEPWASLSFAIDFPQRDSFQVLVEGNEVTLRAIGDLDCDGANHTFEIEAQVGADGQLPGRPQMYGEQEAE